MTDVMIGPLKRDLVKAGIKMELIEGLDCEIVGKKEFKQMSFSKWQLLNGGCYDI